MQSVYTHTLKTLVLSSNLVFNTHKRHKTGASSKPREYIYKSTILPKKNITINEKTHSLFQKTRNHKILWKTHQAVKFHGKLIKLLKSIFLRRQSFSFKCSRFLSIYQPLFNARIYWKSYIYTHAFVQLYPPTKPDLKRISWQIDLGLSRICFIFPLIDSFFASRISIYKWPMHIFQVSRIAGPLEGTRIQLLQTWMELCWEEEALFLILH